MKTLSNFGESKKHFICCDNCNTIYVDKNNDKKNTPPLIDTFMFDELDSLECPLCYERGYRFHSITNQAELFFNSDFICPLKPEHHATMVMLSFQEPENPWVKRYFLRKK